MSYFSDRLLKIHTAEMPVNGSLLISRPFLDDTNFSRSVVLMVDCEEAHGEALGIILNRPLDLGINDALGGLDLPGNPPLYLGGPVGHDRLVVVHRLGSEIIPDSIPLGDDLYIGGDFEAVQEYVRAGGETEGMLKFVVGYSGWSRGQLRRELDEATWAIGSLPVDDIMGDGGPYMWKQAVARLDQRYDFWKRLPLKACLN
ncbi:MAG: YqgE/AlgH family protein [Muribaculaceae bacterium]|nr:YqgE/AlgH family protein [Muribaculaceae bacterium]